MKKVLYLLALFVSVTLASCNGCTTATDKDIGSKPLAEFEVIPGSVALSSASAQTASL